MINAKEGTCKQCGHNHNEHKRYVKGFKPGFSIWQISALTRLKEDNICQYTEELQYNYCPEVELKLADINILNREI